MCSQSFQKLLLFYGGFFILKLVYMKHMCTHTLQFPLCHVQVLDPWSSAENSVSGSCQSLDSNSERWAAICLLFSSGLTVKTTCQKLTTHFIIFPLRFHNWCFQNWNNVFYADTQIHLSRPSLSSLTAPHWGSLACTEQRVTQIIVRSAQVRTAPRKAPSKSTVLELSL